MATGKILYSHKTLGTFLVAAGLSVCCLLPLCVLAGGIHGHVFDKKNHQPIAGATVLVIGTHNTASADFNGNYAIDNIGRGSVRIGCKAVGYRPEPFGLRLTTPGGCNWIFFWRN